MFHPIWYAMHTYSAHRPMCYQCTTRLGSTVTNFNVSGSTYRAHDQIYQVTLLCWFTLLGASLLWRTLVIDSSDAFMSKKV